MSSYRTLERNALNPLLSQAVSSTNTYTTPAIDVTSYETVTFQAEWSGTPTGVINVLGSIDGANFRSFGATVGAQPSGSLSGVLIPLFAHGMKYLQLQYANSSGSGILTVTVLGKTR